MEITHCLLLLSFKWLLLLGDVCTCSTVLPVALMAVFDIIWVFLLFLIINITISFEQSISSNTSSISSSVTPPTTPAVTVRGTITSVGEEEASESCCAKGSIDQSIMLLNVTIYCYKLIMLKPNLMHHKIIGTILSSLQQQVIFTVLITVWHHWTL